MTCYNNSLLPPGVTCLDALGKKLLLFFGARLPLLAAASRVSGVCLSSRCFGVCTAKEATLSSVVGCPDTYAGGLSTGNCPTSGSVDLTGSGQNFGSSAFAGASSILVGGRECKASSWNDSQVVCSLPPGAGSKR